jgi:hypothetical protein
LNKVVTPIIGVLCRHGRERTGPGVQDDHQNFHENNCDTEKSRTELARERENGDCDNTTGEKCPDDRVEDLDGSKIPTCARSSCIHPTFFP